MDIAYQQQVENDFDCIADLPESTWSPNIHYHPFILKNIPANCNHILDIGCGKGNLCRKMADRSKKITGLDLSENMIAKAREASSKKKNISFVQADYFQTKFEKNSIDAIVSIATVHHMDMEAFLEKAKNELRVGGKLILVDLYRQEKWFEKISLPFALGFSALLNIFFNNRIRASKKEREYWSEHGKHDKYLSMAELKKTCSNLLPKATLERRLFWRYTLFWIKMEYQTGHEPDKKNN